MRNPGNPARQQHALVGGTFAPGETNAIAAALQASWTPPAELVRARKRRGETEDLATATDDWPLRFLQIEVFNACNYRCPLCSTLDDDHVTRRRMSLAEFEQVVSPVASELLAVILYGNRGEPLLHPDLPAMIRFLTQRSRAKSVISTNASRLDEARAEALMDAGVSQIIFAIDGISQQSYGAYRVGGVVETVLANLRASVALKQRRGYATRIVWQFIPMGTNEHERDEVVRMGEEIGVDEVRFKISRSATRSATFRPEADENRRQRKEVVDRFDCPYGLDKLYVDPNGDCYPCCYAEGKGLLVGNALETPLDELWRSPAMWTLRRSFVEQRSFHPFCASTCDDGHRGPIPLRILKE